MVEDFDQLSSLDSTVVAHAPLVRMEDSHWLAPPTESFQVNFDVAYMDRGMGCGAIVRDLNDEVMLAIDSDSFLSGFVELAKVVTMFKQTFLKLLRPAYLLFGLKQTPKLFQISWLGRLDIQLRFNFLLMLFGNYI